MARNYSNGAAVTERGQFRANNDARVARRTSTAGEEKEKIFRYRLPDIANYRIENSCVRTHLLLLDTRYFIQFFILIWFIALCISVFKFETAISIEQKFSCPLSNDTLAFSIEYLVTNFRIKILPKCAGPEIKF